MGTVEAPQVAVGSPGGDAGASRPYAPPQRMWPATFRSVHRARHALEVTLRDWELGDLVDAAGLALSELMGNAVEHAYVPGRSVGVSVFRIAGGGVALEVHDAQDERMPLRAEASLLTEAAPDQDRGRGLALVDAVTGGRWGTVKRDGPGKVVWAELGDLGDLGAEPGAEPCAEVDRAQGSAAPGRASRPADPYPGGTGR